MFKTLFYISTLLSISNPNIQSGNRIAESSIKSFPQSNRILSVKSISLEKRNEKQFVNDVFRDNILLTLRYMKGDIEKKSDIVWDDVRKPLTYEFYLGPGEVFAFHDQVSKEFGGKTIKTTNSHFNFQEGFKSDGYLTGDGVCHLASLMYWAAKDAGIEALAPSSHDFATIEGIPGQFGVAIFNSPDSFDKGARENLYITNNTSQNIRFVLNYDGLMLTVLVIRENT